MRFIATALLLLTAVASSATELTVMVGRRDSTASFLVEGRSSEIACITTPCILAEARPEEADVTGLILDVPISRQWAVEALYNELDGELRLVVAPELGLSQLGRETFEATTAQVGLRRHFGVGTSQPFLAATVGATRFETSALAYDPLPEQGAVARPVSDEVLSASIAAGLRLALTRSVGLRLEGRYYWANLSDNIGGPQEQTELSAGLGYRW